MQGDINKISELDFICSPTSERKKKKRIKRKNNRKKTKLADEIDFNWTFLIYVNEICPGKLYHFLDYSVFSQEPPFYIFMGFLKGL